MTTLSKHQKRVAKLQQRKLQLEHQLKMAKAVIGRNDEMADFDADMELDEALD